MDYNDFDPDSHEYWSDLSRYLVKGILILAMIFVVVALIFNFLGILP